MAKSYSLSWWNSILWLQMREMFQFLPPQKEKLHCIEYIKQTTDSILRLRQKRYNVLDFCLQWWPMYWLAPLGNNSNEEITHIRPALVSDWVSVCTVYARVFFLFKHFYCGKCSLRFEFVRFEHLWVIKFSDAGDLFALESCNVFIGDGWIHSTVFKM